MVLAAAIVLIAAVLAASAFAVGSDVFRRPAGERLQAIKDWQGLIGAVLGFMGAAGVLVLSTAIESDRARQEKDERSHTIGLALAYEAERLSNNIAANLGIVNLIRAQPPGQDWQRTCTNFIATLIETLDKEKPVWSAAVGQTLEFGDRNLQLFVRYHGQYDDIIHEAKRLDPMFCQESPENQINAFEQRLTYAFDLYRYIAAAYGTTLVEPAPAAPVTQPAQPAPDTPAATPN